MTKVEKDNKKFIIIGAVFSLLIFGIICIICVGFLLVAGADQSEKNSRDSQRQNQLLDIQVAIEESALSYGEYPESIEVSGSSLQIREEQISLSGHLDISNETDNESTAYCYIDPGNGSFYALGVQLEDGSWFNVSIKQCDSSDIIK